MAFIKLGFTGTKEGLSNEQLRSIESLLSYLKSLAELEIHLGDCIGADDQVWKIAKKLNGIRTIGHPPSDSTRRAFNLYDEERPKRGFLERNHDIVDETVVLLAGPREDEEILRSGTWATVRYARLLGRPVYRFLISGKISRKELIVRPLELLNEITRG